MWLHSLKVAQLLRSAACLHTNQSRSYFNHLVLTTANSLRYLAELPQQQADPASSRTMRLEPTSDEWHPNTITFTLDPRKTPPTHLPPRTYHRPSTLRHYASRASSDFSCAQLPITSNHTSAPPPVALTESRPPLLPLTLSCQYDRYIPGT